MLMDVLNDKNKIVFVSMDCALGERMGSVNQNRQVAVEPCDRKCHVVAQFFHNVLHGFEKLPRR